MKLFLRFIHKSFLLILVVLVGCPTTEEINKTDPDTLLNQGIKHLDKGQYDKAFSDFTKAIEINPSAEAYYRRGTAYKYKDWCEFLKGICIDPKYADAYYRSIDAYADKAISDFSKAIELNPKYADAYCRRGIAYVDKAVSEGAKARRIDPENAETYTRRKDAYLDKAISDFNKAIELNPKYAEV